LEKLKKMSADSLLKLGSAALDELAARSPEEKGTVFPLKKQHFRVKKVILPLETGFFSSSIRSASGEAVFRW
jgi:hypothetical protein